MIDCLLFIIVYKYVSMTKFLTCLSVKIIRNYSNNTLFINHTINFSEILKSNLDKIRNSFTMISKK